MNTILCEKDPALRDVIAETLSRTGHVVHFMTSVDETLHILSEKRGIDLLVIGATVNEPGDGMRFVSKMQGSDFTIPYILATGDMALINNLPPGIDRDYILQKPFVGNDLIEKVNRLVSTPV